MKAITKDEAEEYLFNFGKGCDEHFSAKFQSTVVLPKKSTIIKNSENILTTKEFKKISYEDDLNFLAALQKEVIKRYHKEILAYREQQQQDEKITNDKKVF